MRKLYKEFFYVPKHGNICEKVMVTRVATTVAVMIACLAAMSLTAYAYFSVSDSGSMGNFVGSAKYELTISVSDGESPVILTDNVFTAEAGKEYTVSLQYNEGSAETGFCGIRIGEKYYHTEQLGADLDAENGLRGDTQFTIYPEGSGSIAVELIPHWGTSIHYALFSEMGENDEFYVIRGRCIALELVDGVIPETYTIQYGDYLSKIAELYDTTVERLVAYNNIADPDSIDVGQIIKIPPASWEPSTSQSVPSAPQQEPSASQQAPSVSQQEEPEDELMGTAPLLPVNPSNPDESEEETVSDDTV